MYKILSDLKTSRLTKLAEANTSTEAERVRLEQEIAGVVDQAKLGVYSLQVAKEQAGKCFSGVSTSDLLAYAVLLDWASMLGSVLLQLIVNLSSIACQQALSLHCDSTYKLRTDYVVTVQRRC